MNKVTLLRTLIISAFFLTAVHFCYSQCEMSHQTLWRMDDGNSAVANHADYTAQNDLLVCGNSSSRGLVVHFNGTTGIRWAKTFLFGNQINLVRVMSLSDGGIAVAGYASINNVSALLVLKLTGNGDVVWAKRLHDISSVPGLTNQHLLISAMTETPDGGIAICGRKVYLRPSGGTNNRIFLFKLGADGNVAWTREDTQGNEDEPTGMLMDQGSIVVVGTTYSVTSGIRYGFLEKLNPITGSIQSLKRYQIGNLDNNWFRSIEKNATGYSIGTQAFYVGGGMYNIFQTNSSGDQLSCKKIPSFGPNLVDQYYYPTPISNGGHLLWQNQYYSSDNVELSRIDVNGNIQWTYSYPHAGRQTIQKLLPGANGSAVGIGSSPDPQNPNGIVQIYILATRPDGQTVSCANDPKNLIVKDSLNYNISNGTWQTTTLNFQPPYDLALQGQNATLSSLILCQNNSCQINNLSIVGDTVICSATTAKFTARITGTCSIPAQWSLSPANGTIQNINDSTVQIHFTQPGSAILKVEVNPPCSTYSKETIVEYRPVTHVLDLGADKFLCPGNTLTLSTGAQFTSILWMNGSTNNSMQVSTAGEYSVIASTDGFCFLKDTISVVMYPKPQVELSNDSVLCGAEAHLLDAGNGYASYLWQDGSTQSIFSVNNLGIYWVRVTDNNGCIAGDTAVISAFGQIPQAFTLFKDTALCFGEKILLKTVGDYAHYNWENGTSSNADYWANKPGDYSITVTNKHGCAASEIISVKEKFCKNELYVPTAFTPNKDGLNDNFRAICYSPLDFFELSIYNRWGERVFQSDDIKKGWNGDYKSQKQQADVFVWFIRYRFIGSTYIMTQKGTVMLVR